MKTISGFKHSPQVAPFSQYGDPGFNRGPASALAGGHSPLYNDAVCLENEEDAVPLIRKMLSGQHPGILATVGAHRQPQMRWMASLSLDFYPHLYALTAPGSRKVAEIAMHPEVTWIFFSRDLSLTTVLRGQATVVTDLPTIRSVARHMPQPLREPCVERYLEGKSPVVLDTIVESVECESPSFRYLARADDFNVGRMLPESAEDLRDPVSAGGVAC